MRHHLLSPAACHISILSRLICCIAITLICWKMVCTAMTEQHCCPNCRSAMCICLSDDMATMAPPLMILDELDSGVGARLGKSIGRLLRRMGGTQLSTQHPNTHQLSLQSELSQQHQHGAHQQSKLQPEPECMTQHQLASASQILCVSHLPQVSTFSSLRCNQSHCRHVHIPDILHSLHEHITTA